MYHSTHNRMQSSPLHIGTDFEREKKIWTGGNFEESDEAISSKSETRLDKDTVAVDNKRNVSGCQYRIL
jgi:hypothetical protein